MNLNEKEIYKLHQKYSAGENQKELLDVVWAHSKIVGEISNLIVNNLNKNFEIKVNKELIKWGALVHDIGCYKCEFSRKNKIPYIQHGEIGYKILINEGFSKNLARFSLVHIGVGLEDNIPITLEEEIVTYADNFHSKKGFKFNNFEKEKKALEKFNKDNAVIMERFRKKFGEPDLKEISN